MDWVIESWVSWGAMQATVLLDDVGVGVWVGVGVGVWVGVGVLLPPPVEVLFKEFEVEFNAFIPPEQEIKKLMSGAIVAI